MFHLESSILKIVQHSFDIWEWQQNISTGYLSKDATLWISHSLNSYNIALSSLSDDIT